MRRAKTKSLPFGSMSIDTNFKDSFLSENTEIQKCAEEDKRPFGVSIGPGTVLGALIGAAIGVKKNGERQRDYQDRLRIMNAPPNSKKTAPSMQGGYYSQATNLAKNLRVVFTPVSAIYLVKNGSNDVAIETINVDRMDDVMLNAWQRKDQDFFKRMLLNKMLMEINLAEKMFAKNIVANQQILTQNIAKRSGIKKTASFDMEDDLCGYLDSILKMRSYYDGSSESQKLASVLGNMINGTDVLILPGLGEEPEKYASLGKVEDVFGINASTSNIRSLKSRLEKPLYLKKHLQVGFLPDRVSFVVDNTLITTMSVFDMNNKGFEAFKKQDQKYFKKLFSQTIKIKPGINKTAAEGEQKVKLLNIPRATAFRMNEIHPYVYYQILKKKYGKAWNNCDLSALIKRIELDFKLEGTGIPDIPLNKIMSIYTCLSDETINAFTSSLAFEKIARSFNDLPIDFLTAENEGLGIGEITFALECYAQIMADRNVDSYELFSEEVISYIADVMLSKDIVVIYPETENRTDTYMEFYTNLNRKILDKLIEKNNIDAIDSENIDMLSAKQNEILQPMAIQALTAIRAKQVSKDLASEYIDELCESNEFDMTKDELLRRQIQINLNTDDFLKGKLKAERAQMELYRLV